MSKIKYCIYQCVNTICYWFCLIVGCIGSSVMVIVYSHFDELIFEPSVFGLACAVVFDNLYDLTKHVYKQQEGGSLV